MKEKERSKKERKKGVNNKCIGVLLYVSYRKHLFGN